MLRIQSFLEGKSDENVLALSPKIKNVFFLVCSSNELAIQKPRIWGKGDSSAQFQEKTLLSLKV